jgi:CDP-4-dehydro-6-deoxyglucose reductase
MSFTVTVRPSGRSFVVDGDETVLAAALRQGVGIAYGCKNGACGSCRGKVIEGAVAQGPHSASALSAADAARGLALFCCARPESDLVIEARELTGFGDIPVRKMPVRIARIERAAPDVAIVTLQLPANERLQYRAGQYLEFILKDGRRRHYSIATPPHADEQLQFHVRHMAGGVFTDALFGAAAVPIKERDILRVEGPMGTFFLREDNPRPIVLLAGGTGFAPIKALAEHIFAERINHEDGGKVFRPVVLYWGARSRQDLYLDALPARWAAEQPNFRYVPVLSEPKVDDGWSGRTGFVHRALMQDMPDLSAHQVYACGAPGMINAARNDLTTRCGLPEDQFFADAFTSQADVPDAAR